jgi:signal transduction histidine kinase
VLRQRAAGQRVDDVSDTGRPVSFTGLRHGGFNGRPSALRRAIGNLLENAIFYGKRAVVELGERESEWLIRVIDDGPGIPVEFREAAFAPFFRVEASRNRNTGGTGLGLSIARSIVRAHGGDICFKDHSDGGFQVEVLLPRLNGRAQRESTAVANLEGEADQALS